MENSLEALSLIAYPKLQFIVLFSRPLKGGAGNVRLATRSVLSVSAKAALTKMNKFD